METKSKQCLHKRQPAVSELDSALTIWRLSSEVFNNRGRRFSGKFIAQEGAQSLFHSLAEKKKIISISDLDADIIWTSHGVFV